MPNPVFYISDEDRIVVPIDDVAIIVHPKDAVIDSVFVKIVGGEDSLGRDWNDSFYDNDWFFSEEGVPDYNQELGRAVYLVVSD